MTYTKADVGCHIDGVFGSAYRRARIAEMVAFVRPQAPLIQELEGEPSDDLSEEDDAINLLNDHVEEGVHFEFVDGDLLLLADTEEDQ